MARVIETAHRVAEADLAVVLQRTGALAYWAVIGYAEARGLALPPAIEALIGREISYEFEERTGIMLNDYKWRVTNDTPLPYHLKSDDDIETYYAWLEKRSRRETSQVSRVIRHLQGAASAMGRLDRVMIVDESSYQGPTLYMTAPFIVRKAFPCATIQASYLFQEALCGLDLCRANFAHLTPHYAENRAEAALVHALMLGHVDYRGSLERLDEHNLRRVGKRIASHSATVADLHPRNPAPGLIARYGMEALLSLHPMAIDAMRRYGQSLA
jgi:hypothetical protein